MSLTDNQIKGLLEDSVLILRQIAVRLNAKAMANNKYELRTILFAIEMLETDIPNKTNRQINGLTKLPESAVSSSMTDSQIEAHVAIVLGYLDQILDRLVVSPMADKSITAQSVENSCNALEYKKLPDSPTRVIDSLTTHCQLKLIHVLMA